jgi:hypothetical protein
MSTNKTENYGLHVWEAGDDFLREEFNENFSLIDAGIAEKATVVIGTYTGTNTSEREIVVGFRPSMVILVNKNGSFTSSRYAGGIIGLEVESINGMRLTDQGFKVYCDSYNGTNLSDFSPFLYAAFR